MQAQLPSAPTRIQELLKPSTLVLKMMATSTACTNIDDLRDIAIRRAKVSAFPVHLLTHLTVGQHRVREVIVAANNVRELRTCEDEPTQLRTVRATEG